MSAKDTFIYIYSQLHQLINKLNNLRHEILSNNNKKIYIFMYHVSGVLFGCHNDYIFVFI